MALPVEHLVSLELNRDVFDPEQAHRVVDVPQHVLVLVRLADDAVGTHGDHRRRHRPHVQIVHGFYSRNGLELPSHRRQWNVRRSGLQ